MNLLKRVLCLTLSFSLAVSATALDLSGWTWGTVTSISEQEVAPETTYSRITVSSPTGPQSINAIEFNPKNQYITMRAGLSNGEIYGTQTVAGMANDFNKRGEGQVVAAINADFFNFGEGVPFGIFMDGGEILSTPPQYSVAFGIKSDGTPFCQSHGTIMNKTLIIGDYKTQLTAINCRHGKTEDSIILYNSLFDQTTRSPSDSVEVVLTHHWGEFRHGEEIVLSVDEIIPEGGNTKIPEGKMVLSARGVYKDVLNSLMPEQEISVKIEFTDFWSDVTFAVAGSHLLLKDGQFVDTPNTERTARTLIGIKPDGNVVFYTIDGKMSDFSVGATQKQAATIMRDLGCVDAINLDGGGSTTFAMRYLGTNTVKMINRSASSARAVANSAILVNTAPYSFPTKLILASAPTKLLTGYSHKYGIVGGIDDNYLSYEISSPVSWSVNEDAGVIAEDGTFTPLSSGIATIGASVDDLYAETYCTVVDFADTIVARDSLTVKSEETVDIPVSLTHEGTSLSFTNDMLTWEVEGDIGEFTEPGKFTAATYKAEGKIIIRHGEAVKEIAVNIDGPKPLVEPPFTDMEAHQWAKDALFNLYNAEIINGVSETEFAPAREIKRADFILMLLRLMEIEIDTVVTDQFEDVPLNSYYYYELATAKRLGITQGTSPTTFSPDRSITRQEMFTLTWRVLDIATEGDAAVLDTFIDKDDIAEYAKSAFSTLVSLNLVAGDNNGRVNPTGNATRAESAVFLDRVYTHIKGESLDEHPN